MIYEAREELSRNNEFRYVHRWESDRRDSWTSLVVIHGLGDHGGRFHQFAEWMCERGVRVLAMDLVGHGRSPGRRGCIDSYESLLDEVNLAIDFDVRSREYLPCFLFGQSMGGNLVLNNAIRKARELPNRLAGIVSCGAMLQAFQTPGDQFLAVGRRLSRWFPNFCVKAPVQVERLCRNRDAQEAYLRDDRVHRNMSLRLGISLLESGSWAIEHAESLRIPALLMHGANDELTSPEGTRKFAERAGKWAEFKLWDGLLHDMHCEPEWQSVLSKIRDWMSLTLLGSPAAAVA